MSQRRVPTEIYWRRRLLVLAAVIAVVWVVLQAVDDGDADEKAAVTPTATPAPTVTTPAPVNGTINVSLSTGTTACDPEKVRVAPAVKPGQYAGDAIKVTMSVSTTEEKACTLNARSADLLVVISADKKPIWDSSVCDTALLSEPVALSANWATVVETTWSGRGSGPNCSPKEGFANAGTYVIKSATLGGEPGQDTFRLVNNPQPTPKPTKPTAKSSTKPDE